MEDVVAEPAVSESTDTRNLHHDSTSSERISSIVSQIELDSLRSLLLSVGLLSPPGFNAEVNWVQLN